MTTASLGHPPTREKTPPNLAARLRHTVATVAGVRNQDDIDASMTPYDAELGDFVDLTRNDDLFGKDALKTADRRTRMYGVSCVTAEPLIGAPVSRGSTQIGVVTAASWSPYLKRGIGYVRLESADFAERRTAEVVGFDLSAHSCEIVELPLCSARPQDDRDDVQMELV